MCRLHAVCGANVEIRAFVQVFDNSPASFEPSFETELPTNTSLRGVTVVFAPRRERRISVDVTCPFRRSVRGGRRGGED